MTRSKDGYCPHGVYVGGVGVDWMCGPCEDGDTAVVETYGVSCGVHGASRVIEREYPTLDEAKAKALRWSQSNSTGHYWAQVRSPEGALVAQYN